MALALDDEPIGPIGPLWEPGQWRIIPAFAATIASIVALILAVPVSSSTPTDHDGHEAVAAAMIHLSSSGVSPTVLEVPAGATAQVMNLADTTHTLTVGSSTGSVVVTVHAGGSAPLDLSSLAPGAYVFTDGTSAGTLTVTG